jgi:very-short-patch-repair endonuclease
MDENRAAEATLSPGLPGGGTRAALDKLRARLLDLTNRNRLLNFRHSSASCLRVVDVDLDSVFSSLMNGEEIPFRYVPEPDVSPEFDDHEPQETPSKPNPADIADALGWQTSYDLTAPSAHNADSQALPVLLYVEDLETKTRKISSAAKTAIEESGTNMLYLTFGFLEWYESDDSRQAHLAPLFAVPVALNRKTAKGNAFRASVEFSGDDYTTNLSLAEKMRRDFAVDIPAIEDDDTPTSYFSRFQAILEQKKRWRIRRHLSLSLLSFGKLLMYLDLDAKFWPSLEKHPRVTELLDGMKHDGIVHAEEYAIDAPDMQQDVPMLVVDADSSQHSALIDTMRGQNLVIEGPPGTGKSQTITNLIAAALTNGKTVLFVSEKLAALEVVRRRLDEAGLGIFCLELHSHKTRKDALLNDLATRLKTRGAFRDPRELDQHLSEVEEKKRLLTGYANLINTELQPFKATVFDILWARDLAYQELTFDRALVDKLLLATVVQFTRRDVAQTEQFLSAHAKHISGVLRTCSNLVEHPWAWVNAALSFEDQECICDLLETFTSSVQNVVSVHRALAGAGVEVPLSVQGLTMAAEILATLPIVTERLLPSVLAPCRDARARAAFLDFMETVENAVKTRQVMAGATSTNNAASLLRKDVGDLLGGVVAVLASRGHDNSDSLRLRQDLELGRTAEKLLSRAGDRLVALTALVGLKIAFDTHNIQRLLNCLGALENAPIELLHLRTPHLESEDAARIIESAAVTARGLEQQHRGLDESFDLSILTDPSDVATLRTHAVAIETASLLQRCFGRQYRIARRAYKVLARHKTKESRTGIARHLRAVADYIERRARFDADERCRVLLGADFKGIQTKWNDWQIIAEWYQKVFALLPDADETSVALRELLLKSRTERLKAINASLPAHQRNRETLNDLQNAISTLPMITFQSGTSSRSLDELRKALKDTNAFLEEAIAGLQMADVRSDLPINAVVGLLKTAETHRASLARIEAHAQVRQILGSHFHGIDSDLRLVEAAVHFAERLATSAIPAHAVTWLLCEEYESRIGQLRQWLEQAAQAGRRMAECRRDVRGRTASSDWHADEHESLEDVSQKATRALANREELAQWLHFLRSRSEALERGLGKLTGLVEDGHIEPDHLLSAFSFVFYNTLARYAFTDHQELFGFSGTTQDQVREQFAKADKEAIRLYRERAAAIIDSRKIPYGHQSGPVKGYTELALITHEISKQKRHIPIRQLVRRSATALQAMKPCFMMGPLSVAQYLIPERLCFDLVVMDEASQLKPEDAIGAIARGGQLVIVGDPKQLPPTNFFQRVTFDGDDLDDDDERMAIEEGESILDIASTLYQPVRRLRWHYRSRHHSLIAFSNREFYQGDLVIFPSAYHDSPSLGVKYHPVPGGVFDERRNVPEAEAVVDAVVEHMQSRPNESLGVVALNYEQRELVEDLLDRRLATEPFAIAYQERMEGGPEPLIIKNLENVQGDERDVIFISATYGPDAKGNQYQRFGPINGPNGHRRLNVLFTRARKRTEVFSSLDPDKIQVHSGSAWGLRAFKQYLTFARTGILEAAQDTGRQSSNDFERAVGGVLQEKGFEVVPEVGVAGFFIDLAIRHPTKPGAYLLGIECDGASYHSGRSARDRDRLRQEILEKQGWKIHRIWSTDWFRSRNAEIKRLLKKIDELLNSDPDYRKDLERAQRVASLRQQLIDLRETDIKVTYPNSPAEQCLLRQPLLDELVRRRPRTRTEWFSAISYDLRSQTDAKQVGQYLDKVLQIIRTSYE